MPKLTLRTVARYSLRGWGLVLITGVVLTILALIDAPRDADEARSLRISDGSTGCRLRVTVAELRVRSAPSTDSTQVETLPEGAVVDGLLVVTDGFRELRGDRWAADQFLTPLPDSVCS